MKAKLYVIVMVVICFLLLGSSTEAQITRRGGADNILIGELQPAKQSGIAGPTGPTIINFDDLPTAGKGTGDSYISVTDQYRRSKGITFNSPVVIDFSQGIATPTPYSKGIDRAGFAHSMPNAIEQCYPPKRPSYSDYLGDCPIPIEIKFNQGQSRVKVWVGVDTEGGGTLPVSVTLRAFNSAGKLIAKDEKKIPSSVAGAVPIQTSLEASTLNTRNYLFSRPDITRVTVFLKSDAYPNPYPNLYDSFRLAVDDVEFERVEGVLPESPTVLQQPEGIGAYNQVARN